MKKIGISVVGIVLSFLLIAGSLALSAENPASTKDGQTGEQKVQQQQNPKNSVSQYRAERDRKRKKVAEMKAKRKAPSTTGNQEQQTSK